MQRKWTWGLLVLGLFASHAAPILAKSSAGIAQRGAPDPLLGGPVELGPEKPGPCDPALESPDYRAGTDVHGRPVAAADLPHAPMPAPQSILVQPGGTLVELDPRAALERQPACPPAPKARPAR